MNARLNGQLVGVDLNIQKMSDYQNAMSVENQQILAQDDPTLDEPLKVEGMSSLIIESLVSAGYDTLRKVLNASREELSKIPEIGRIGRADEIIEEIRQKKGLKIG